MGNNCGCFNGREDKVPIVEEKDIIFHHSSKWAIFIWPRLYLTGTASRYILSIGDRSTAQSSSFQRYANTLQSIEENKNGEDKK